MPRVEYTAHNALLGTIDPDAYAAAAYTSDWASMADAGGCMGALIATGTLGASATVDAKLQQATDSSGTGAKDITGKAITQLVKASNDDDQAWINVKQEDLDVAGGFTHVAIVLTVGTATSDAGAFLFGSPTDYPPASNVDLASVVEIV
jgi:hypothetical protein